MNSPIQYFSSDYFEARGKFLDACNIAGASVRSFLNPKSVGPDGRELYTDIAYIGPPDAPLLFIVASGTHGVEGFLGSGCQVGYLTEKCYQDRPGQSAVVLVHAMNPFGFAHVRRVNEDNVDLNRNFVDHMIPYPEKPDYELVHPWLVPNDWDGPFRADSDKAIANYIQKNGFSEYQRAVSSGQYRHADGVFYGGDKPTWSNDNWRQFVAEFVPDRQRIGFLDLHTGLGPYGYGEPIFLSWPDMEQYERARQWYGEEVTAPEAGDSTSSAVQGVVATAFHGLGTNTEITAIALEYGTIPVEDVLEAIRADNWLYVHGVQSTAIGREIKQQIRDAFYCDADDWKNLVWDRAVDILHKGFVGLDG